MRRLKKKAGILLIVRVKTAREAEESPLYVCKKKRACRARQLLSEKLMFFYRLFYFSS
ncbi:hypothetical protein ACEQPO_11790 [Bacillus sp. SL00103]